jgi:hypothetical protein
MLKGRLVPIFRILDLHKALDFYIGFTEWKTREMGVMDPFRNLIVFWVPSP